MMAEMKPILQLWWADDGSPNFQWQTVEGARFPTAMFIVAAVEILREQAMETWKQEIRAAGGGPPGGAQVEVAPEAFQRVLQKMRGQGDKRASC